MVTRKSGETWDRFGNGTAAFVRSAGHGYTTVAGADTKIPVASVKYELQEEMYASDLLQLIYMLIYVYNNG